MLSKARRIPSKDFPKNVPGKMRYSEHLKLKDFPGLGRVAVVISKKTEPSAVKRHALKRRLMSIIEKTDIHGRDIILMPQKGSSRLTSLELRVELSKIIN